MENFDDLKDTISNIGEKLSLFENYPSLEKVTKEIEIDIPAGIINGMLNGNTKNINDVISVGNVKLDVNRYKF